MQPFHIVHSLLTTTCDIPSAFLNPYNVCSIRSSYLITIAFSPCLRCFAELVSFLLIIRFLDRFYLFFIILSPLLDFWLVSLPRLQILFTVSGSSGCLLVWTEIQASVLSAASVWASTWRELFMHPAENISPSLSRVQKLKFFGWSAWDFDHFLGEGPLLLGPFSQVL